MKKPAGAFGAVSIFPEWWYNWENGLADGESARGRKSGKRVEAVAIWNPWHGCHKISPGCQNCYVYRRDAQFDKDSSVVNRTSFFDLPLRRDRKGFYKLQPEQGTVYVCMTSDFFLQEADEWRPEAWAMMRERKDLSFVIITKRIHRFLQCIPKDWNEGYENVAIQCTCENQEMADYRLPLLLQAPIRHRSVIHEPMLGPIEIGRWLSTGKIERVVCGGESGPGARLCDYDWILHTREQCMQYNVSFYFKQTGALFRKGERIYRIERKHQMEQARKACIDYAPGKEYISFETLFERLNQSAFRSCFSLKEAELNYLEEKGMETVRRHAEDFVRMRLAPAQIPNDGRQTPMKGHPVFLAQHATGTCCRGCLCKWHGIPKGKALTEEQQRYVTDVIMEWIRRQHISGKKGHTN